MNQTTTTRPRLQGNYPATERSKPEVHPIKAEINSNIGSFTFTATFEEDAEAVKAFKNQGLIAYRCILTTPEGRTIGIGHGLNVLSADNRYLSKAAKWAHGGAFIQAVTNAVKFPSLSGETSSDFGMGGDIASEFMASQKQKDYLKQLIANVADEEERERLLGNLESLSKEDASDLIGRLRN